MEEQQNIMNGDSIPLGTKLQEGLTKIQKPVFWFALGYLTHVVIKWRQKKYVKI